MKTLIHSLFQEYNRIGILGFGKEGRSTYTFIRHHFPHLQLHIFDKNIELKNESLASDTNLSLCLGEDHQDHLNNVDLVFVSPGFHWQKLKDNHPTIKFVTQTQLFLECFHRQIIGVTGTKGKSTTSSLIAHVFEKTGRKVILLGNIGKPPFDHIGEITESSHIVFELSSHQLQSITVAPDISIILNLFPEHLDYYDDAQQYYNAKLRLVDCQTNTSKIIFNANSQEIVKKIDQMKNQLALFAVSRSENGQFQSYVSSKELIAKTNQGEIFRIKRKHIRLIGEHNAFNALCAALALYQSGLSVDQIDLGLQLFNGLEHRLEFVPTTHNKVYYNDSIATIPEATIEALKSIDEVDTLILGGYERDLDYSKLADFLQIHSVRNIVFSGPAGLRLFQQLAKIIRTNIYFYHSFDAAVVKSMQLTTENKVCLLSPAAASYDQFKSFEERGARFKELVQLV